jgi:hypothetical protein
LYVTLYAPRTHVQRLIERIAPGTADPTIKVGPLKFDSPHHRLDAAAHRAAGSQQARTGGTGHLLSTLFLLMGVLHDRLGHTTGELLP